MTMQKRLRGMILTVAMSFAAYGAYAENITVSTFYPSPFGSYQTLDSSGQTHLATGGAATVGVRIGSAVNAVAGTALDVTGPTHITNAGTALTVTGNAVASGSVTGGTLALNGGAAVNTGVTQFSCAAGLCYATYAP